MLEAFEPLLKQAMGLDVASIGPTAIQRAVRERLAACKLDDVHAYWDHVRNSASELQELIEAVVVPETWFFRDREAFSALARLAHEEWPRTRPQGTLRLLSLPCSTGEEPYSMVMALADAGLPLSRIQIDAVDISRRALAHAQDAIYTRNSFRGSNLDFRRRHFEPKAHGFHVLEAVRQPVRFLHGNLLDDGFLPGAEIYDVIFCRNLLIYFDRPTQERALAVLSRLLAAHGFLFVGPSETALLLDRKFVSTRMPMTFAFRKAGAVQGEPKPSVAAPAVRPKAARPEPPQPRRHQRAPGHHGHVAKPHSPPQPETSLHEAQRLADQGRLTNAMAYCQRYVGEHGPSAEAFYLMGLVNDAAGREQDALQQYRKTLYLDPTHHEALIHLATLLENQGDRTGAQLLYARAKRKPGGVAT